MPDVHNSLRLGDLLVEKGLITRPQLRQAIEIQQALQTQRFGGKNINARTELGEILIELGFISRHQLQSNLNWQRRLRATTAVMVFIAPLLTAACGGGGGGGGGSSATNTPVKTEVTSSQQVSGTPQVPEPATKTSSDNSSSTDVSQSPVPTPTPTSSSEASVSSLEKSSSSSSAKSAAPASSTASSKISSSQMSSISSTSSSSKPASSSSSSSFSSSSSTSIVDGPVQLYWNVPNQRENGNYLDITEIGGYEVRYKLKTDSEFKTIKITDGFLDAYYFNYLKGDYQFQIATFDKEGLYSDFIDIDPS